MCRLIDAFVFDYDRQICAQTNAHIHAHRHKYIYIHTHTHRDEEPYTAYLLYCIYSTDERTHHNTYFQGSIEDKRQERRVTITGATSLLTHRAVELVNARILEWKASFSNNNGHVDDGTSGSSLKRSRNDATTTATTSISAATSSSTNTGYQNYPVNHNQNMTQNLIGPQPQQQHQQQQLQLQQQQLQLQQQYQQLQQQQYGMTPYAQTGQIATSAPGTATQQHQPSLLEQQYNQAFALFTQMQGAAQQQAQLADPKQGMSTGQVQGHGQYAQQQYPQAHPGR